MKCLIILVILMEPFFSMWCKFVMGVIFIWACQIMHHGQIFIDGFSSAYLFTVHTSIISLIQNCATNDIYFYYFVSLNFTSWESPKKTRELFSIYCAKTLVIRVLSALIKNNLLRFELLSSHSKRVWFVITCASLSSSVLDTIMANWKQRLLYGDWIFDLSMEQEH